MSDTTVLKKQAMTKPIIQAALIMAIFYIAEIILVYFELTPNRNILWTVDILLRIVLGIAGLVLLKRHSDAGESKYTVKELFTNRIPAKTWLVSIPFLIYILLPFLNVFIADSFTTELIGSLSILIIQQFATGFYEEGVQRGLMMNGLIKHNTGTVKQRILTVVIAGAFFGLGHAPNIVFGENPLVQVPSSFLCGMFFAAVYMLSDNILLVMLLHALSDSTLRIVNYMFGYARDGALYRFFDCSRDVIDYLILPLVAIFVCVYYDKLEGSRKEGQ